MILKALYDYYNRCEGLAQKGLELKEIGYLIVIDKDGSFLRIESRMKDKKTAQAFIVLQTVKRSGKKYIPNYLWDNYEYVIGGSGESTKKNKTFLNMIAAFKEQAVNDSYLDAIAKFYKNNGVIEETIKKDLLYDEMLKSNKNISFLLQGEFKIAAEDKAVWDLVLNQNNDDINGTCLVTGQKRSISRLHTKIKLTKDTGPLVSFKTDRGYDSYGKEQGYNAQISEEAEFAYTTALNAMLQKGSHNKFCVGNRTFVFWASSNNEASEQTEESLFDLLEYTEEEVDDPNAKIEQVRKVFTAIYSGSLKTSLEDRFYILGLAPNSARIAVVYWSESSLREFAGKILQHFKDMEIIDTRKEGKPYMGIKDMLAAVTLSGKQSEATNLPEAIVNSIFQGTTYPFTLFSACIRRIRAESGSHDKKAIRIARMAIIKAYLNRTNSNNQKIEIMLDKSNTNQGYLCGRLFAVLENLQYAANKQDSIRSGYMNAASSTPSAIYPTILKLSNSHYSKLAKDKKGLAIYFDNQKKEIMAQISDFPDTLDLSDQGRFFLGYYHQKNHEENKETED